MNSNSEGIEVLAATAKVYQEGYNPSRIVLCRKENGPKEFFPDGYEYIVWMEIFPPLEESQVSFFSSGYYTDDITEAWENFSYRSKRLLIVIVDGYESPVTIDLKLAAAYTASRIVARRRT